MITHHNSALEKKVEVIPHRLAVNDTDRGGVSRTIVTVSAHEVTTAFFLLKGKIPRRLLVGTSVWTRLEDGKVSPHVQALAVIIIHWCCSVTKDDSGAGAAWPDPEG